MYTIDKITYKILRRYIDMRFKQDGTFTKVLLIKLHFDWMRKNFPLSSSLLSSKHYVESLIFIWNHLADEQIVELITNIENESISYEGK